MPAYCTSSKVGLRSSTTTQVRLPPLHESEEDIDSGRKASTESGDKSPMNFVLDHFRNRASQSALFSNFSRRSNAEFKPSIVDAGSWAEKPRGRVFSPMPKGFGSILLTTVAFSCGPELDFEEKHPNVNETTSKPSASTA